MTEEIKERPALFNGDMVCGILAGLKTNTRRPINRIAGFGEITELQHSETTGYDWIFRDKRMLWNDITHQELLARAPLGKPGDRLWVRETFKAFHGDDRHIQYRADNQVALEDCDKICLLPGCVGSKPKWTPSIHMPRWVSRITLEITDVRVERIQDITDNDCFAEGIQELAGRQLGDGTARGIYRALWDSIYVEDYPWSDNPWAWVYEFKMIPPEAA